jgi:hypothetical protein
MDRMCSELRKLSDNELRRCIPHVSELTAKKRTQSDAGLETDTRADAFRSGPDSVPTLNGLRDASNDLYCLAAPNRTNREQLPNPSKSTDVVPSVHRSDTFVNIPGESYQPTTNDQEYDAPVFKHLNFPQYPSWMDELWFASMPDMGLSADARD